jgi:peptidase M50-like protein
MRRTLSFLEPVLPFLVFLAVLYGGKWLLDIHLPQHVAISAWVSLAALLLAAFAAGTVLHEIGHALAVGLAGERVLGITLGGKLARRTFHLRTIPVSIGLGLGGSVDCRIHRLSAGRKAAVLAAGPAADAVAAPLCLLLPIPHWEATYLGVAVLAAAAGNLAPGHAGDGNMTDGHKLLLTPARLRADAQVRALLADPGWQDLPDAADILINGFRLDVPEAEDCLLALGMQPQALQCVFTRPWTLPDKPDADVTHIVHVLAWKILAAGDLPAETADLAARRLQWVINHRDQDHPDQRTPLHQVRYGLALARLRQRRPHEVQRLCADALAADLDPEERATVLALVAMARHALLLSGQPQLDEALDLDPDAELVSEAASFLNGGWESALAAHDQSARPRGQTGH